MPDGILSNRIAVSLDVVLAATIIYAARRVSLEASHPLVPLMGFLTAFGFAAQMLNFSVLGGTSRYLIGGALLNIILGPAAAFLILARFLIAQAPFLQDGGLIALGAIIFTAFAGYALFALAAIRWARSKKLYSAT